MKMLIVILITLVISSTAAADNAITKELFEPKPIKVYVIKPSEQDNQFKFIKCREIPPHKNYDCTRQINTGIITRF